MLKIETQDDGGAAFYSAAYSPDRVWLCDSCERAPAAFLCKADSASLCAACDAEIHSANPLARRHHRVPIQPVSGSFYGDEDEAASWLLLKNGGDERGLFGGEVDEYLDLDDYATCQNNQVQQHYDAPHGSDSVVPKNQHHCFQLGVDGGFGYPASISQSVSISSMEVGVVPESTSEVSLMSHTRPPKGTIDLFSNPPIQVAPHLSPMDREARVLRYREKKKNRKFEKTIRYASRKAYAETRPRVKGRFAKRRDAEVEVDQMFADTIYGVVPSF